MDVLAEIETVLISLDGVVDRGEPIDELVQAKRWLVARVAP